MTFECVILLALEVRKNETNDEEERNTRSHVDPAQMKGQVTSVPLPNLLLHKTSVVAQLVKKSPPPFMQPEVSSSCSQQPITGPYPELDESSPYLPILFP
jgi:hypothetical protein